MLELLKEDADNSPSGIANELNKVGACMVMLQCGSLRGYEAFMADLAGLRRHILKGRDGIMPANPLKRGTDVTGAPHVFLALMGKFKGELGVREHLIALASSTISGIETRWWLEKLIQVRENEGYTSGPALGNVDGTLASMTEYNAVFKSYLEKVQGESSKLLGFDEDVHANYGLNRTFRKTAQGRARAAALGSDVQDAMNRWKTVENAQGRRPRFSMRDHYSNARDLMPVTWRYSFVQ